MRQLLQVNIAIFKFLLFLNKLQLLQLSILMRTLKFRTFSSKEKEGFIFIVEGTIPQIIFQDLLFQLFQPLFPEITCPEIYYFSSTDQLLNFEEMMRTEDFVYVHFLERVNNYQKRGLLTQKFILCPLQDLMQGITVQGSNIYIISQKAYFMYKKPIFKEMIRKKIMELRTKKHRKVLKYQQYFAELNLLKDNSEIVELRRQLEENLQASRQAIMNSQSIQLRVSKAKATLLGIMKNLGISLKGVRDLY